MSRNKTLALHTGNSILLNIYIKAVGLSHAKAKPITGPEGCPAPLNKTLGAASWNKAL